MPPSVRGLVPQRQVARCALIAPRTCTRRPAALNGRRFVIPDDVKGLFKPLLRHRVVLSPSAEVDGLGTDPVLEQILTQVAAPR